MAAEGDQKYDLKILQEDDEFEEFQNEEWTVTEEDHENQNVWEDNWDDNDVEDEFTQKLKLELEKKGYKPA